MLLELSGGVAVAAVPFVYRYYPLIREIRRRIEDDHHNRLWLLHGSYLQDWLSSPQSHNWRVDPFIGGPSRAFGDIGVHWCDLMEFVTGDSIVSVHSRFAQAVVRDGNHDTEDGAVIGFQTASGAIGSLRSARRALATQID